VTARASQGRSRRRAARARVVSAFAGALHRETVRADRRTEELSFAKELNALGTLAGGVAHDFNSLLAVILNNATLTLARLRHDDPVRPFVEEIREAGTRATELTRRVLTFTRQGAGEPRVLDLRETLRDLERTVRMILGEAIELSMQLDPSPALVRADPTQMEQLLTNLVMNAREAMPCGGRLAIAVAHVRLDAAAARTAGVPVGDYVRMTVADTGVGVPAEVRERIFEPFFTTKEVGRGSGLGLAIVRSVVETAGGDIGVASTPAVGTTFTVHLPRAPTRSAARPPV